VRPTLLRQVRGHVAQMYKSRGSHLDIADFMTLLPHDMQIELGVALQFVDNPATGQRSVCSKVPFFRELGNDELVAIGCKLRHHKAFPPTLNDHSKEARDTYIMREGDRGSEMWVVVEGIVEVERGVGAECESLGKLREGDYFGELAVLCQERPGVHFKRGRSAFACSSRSFASTYALTYSDMQVMTQPLAFLHSRSCY
jgi:hypothetical protein